MSGWASVAAHRCGWVAVGVSVIAGCASYDGRGLQPGIATADDVRRVMGEPAQRHAGDGGELWAYPRGPVGLQTFMVHLDGGGRLRRIEPVLNPEGFSRVKTGMTPDQVQRTLGPPGEVATFERKGETVWDYRFEDDFGYLSFFHVAFGRDGDVASTFITRVYVPGGDPSLE